MNTINDLATDYILDNHPFKMCDKCVFQDPELPIPCNAVYTTHADRCPAFVEKINLLMRDT